MPVEYTEIPPTSEAAPWVECFWWRTGEADGGTLHRVLPDGCVDLLFDVSPDGAEGTRAWAVGTMLRPLLRWPTGREAFLGVRFKPGRASAFLRLSLQDLTDRREPLEAVAGPAAAELTERVAEGRTLPERVTILERLVSRRAARAKAPERWLRPAIDRTIASGGRIGVEELARWAGVSRQLLARRFSDELGVPPKAFCRVLRFRRLLRLAGETRGRTWSELALAAGYYDQAHMIGEVRRLAGAAPTELAAR